VRAEQGTDQVERADQLWVGVVAGDVSITAVNNGIDSLFALLQKLDHKERFEEELRVARSLSRLLAVALRWIDLLRTLHKARAAAERQGDLRAEAWALHQLGTLFLAGQDLILADQTLSEASDLSRSLVDNPAFIATERNLQMLCRTLRQSMREGRIVERSRLRRRPHVSNAFLVFVFLLAFGAATTALAASGLFPGGGTAAASVNQVLPGSGPVAGGTVEALAPIS
jgi:hypothetical protein